MKILKDQKMAEYTSTKTGGIVGSMYYPTNTQELINLIESLKLEKKKFQILGDMTNTVIGSGSLDFDVINMSEFNLVNPILENDNRITVSASYKMKKLTEWTRNNQIIGLEWMEGIPGTVGAGIYMNAGFLIGQDIQSTLINVTYLDIDSLEIKTIANNELNFRYRYSKLQEMNIVILSGTFLVRRIPNDWKKMIRQYRQKKIISAYHNRREKNQPLNLPSAGTVFVPPTPWHVGGLLRELNLVGYEIGGAQISEKSPGFIVNKNAAMTGEDYRDLVVFIQNRIHEKYGVKIIPEVKLMGFKDACD